MTISVPHGDEVTGVDEQRPWPGLISFSEHESRFFFGRRRETEELQRRVRRGIATVLFGGSGLGKTSLIHAGLFPVLRNDGLLPVAIRIDLSADSLHPVVQVKAAIRDAAALAGADIECSSLDWDGATLWELIHRIEFWSPQNRLLTPVLVFDQFEELFTLGRRSPYSAELMTQLEDLIENQIPTSVQEASEISGEAPDFDFERSDFRVLISLREDFLPLFEQITEQIPHLRRNRMRLVPLAPEQALDAVIKPGAGLVDEVVGEEIVRFVADAGDHPSRLVVAPRSGTSAGVEPSLLSLVCRELNAKRMAAGREVISSDLLTEAKIGILADFYARSVDDLAPEVRVFVEEHLLTRTGFRNSIALDDAVGTHGIAAEDIGALVDRRLLRLEDRLGTRRIELTHDVLTRIIRKSRDRRRAREREREELEQRRRELEVKHAAERQRLRKLGVISALLAVAALVFLVLASVAGLSFYKAMKSGEEATTRRLQVDELYNMMLFNLRLELEPLGRLDIVEDMTNKILEQTADEDVADLPPDVARTREVALVLLGDLKVKRGELTTGLESYQEALGIAELLIALDPDNDLWLHDLSVIHQRIGDVHFYRGNLDAADDQWREENRLTRGLLAGDPDSTGRRQELALNLFRSGNLERARGQVESALESYGGALEILTELVEQEPDVTEWQATLAVANESVGSIHEAQGNIERARDSYAAAHGIRRRLADAEPSNVERQSDLASTSMAVGRVLHLQGDLDGAMEWYQPAIETWQRLAEEHPDQAAWQMGVSIGMAANAAMQRSRGDLDGALSTLSDRLVGIDHLATQDATNIQYGIEAAGIHAVIGDLYLVRGEAARALDSYRIAFELAGAAAEKNATNTDAVRLVAACRLRVGDAQLRLGNPRDAVDNYRSALASVGRLRSEHRDSLIFAFDLLGCLDRLSRALWRLGDGEAAREAWRHGLSVLHELETTTEDETVENALSGPLGAVAGCQLFRKSPAEVTAFDIARVASTGSTPKIVAGALGSLARRELFEGTPAEAEQLSRRAIAEDPGQVWLNLTLGHSYLLQGRLDEARELYLEHAGRPATHTMTFREAILEDLRALKEAGLGVPNLAVVEGWLLPE